MLEQEATVVQLENTSAWVEVMPQNGCGKCHTAGGCGKIAFTTLFCQVERYKVDNLLSAQVGDVVKLGIEDGVLWKSALFTYAIPLLGLFLGGLLGQVFQKQAHLSSEFWVIASALLGFSLAIGGLRYPFRMRAWINQSQPRMLEKLAKTTRIPIKQLAFDNTLN